MSNIYNQCGGYRKLHSFNFATIIHLGTMSFCKRYLSWKDDPLGKMLGQMVGASRSGKQNIVEGSERAKTSTETEIKLTDVAKASLSELQGDLEDYLVQKGEVPWSTHNPEHKAIVGIMLDEFEYTEDLLHDYWTYLLAQKQKFDPWLESQDDVMAANALIILIQRATGLLARQLARLERDFVSSGGIKEKMTSARLGGAFRNRGSTLPRMRQPHEQALVLAGTVLGMRYLPAMQGHTKNPGLTA